MADVYESSPALEPMPRFQALDLEQALAFLEVAKQELENNPKAYAELLALLQDYQVDQLDVLGVLQRLAILFLGHLPLLAEFDNDFCPPGYHIQDPATLITPTGTVDPTKPKFYRIPPVMARFNILTRVPPQYVTDLGLCGRRNPLHRYIARRLPAAPTPKALPKSRFLSFLRRPFKSATATANNTQASTPQRSEDGVDGQRKEDSSVTPSSLGQIDAMLLKAFRGVEASLPHRLIDEEAAPKDGLWVKVHKTWDVQSASPATARVAVLCISY